MIEDSKYPCKIINEMGFLCDARINDLNCPNFEDDAWRPFFAECMHKLGEKIEQDFEFCGNCGQKVFFDRENSME